MIRPSHLVSITTLNATKLGLKLFEYGVISCAWLISKEIVYVIYQRYCLFIY